MLAGCQADGPAGMPHQDRGAGHLVMRIEFLDRNRTWLVLLDYFADPLVDFFQTLFQWFSASSSYHPRFQQLRIILAHTDQTIAGDIQSRIDTENNRSRLRAGVVHLHVSPSAG